MSFKELVSKERVIVIASIGLVGVVFLSAMYNYFNPPTRVWEGKVWQVDYSADSTIISSYGNGKIRINRILEIEEEATYRITYRSRRKFVVEFFGDYEPTIEKIS
jgi:hypothetical protein